MGSCPTASSKVALRSSCTVLGSFPPAEIFLKSAVLSCLSHACMHAEHVPGHAQVHWLGSTLPEVPRLQVHGSTLVSVQEPGFVVRGFLWCAAKGEPQLDAGQKEAFKLEGKWPDKETRAIVSGGGRPATQVEVGRGGMGGLVGRASVL